jgi:hypothetical protein
MKPTVRRGKVAIKGYNVVTDHAVAGQVTTLVILTYLMQTHTGLILQSAAHDCDEAGKDHGLTDKAVIRSCFDFTIEGN